MSGAAPPTATAPSRIAALDQLRGYTVWGMLLVNFIGGFAVVHEVFKHRNTYCSYADTIMPLFFFVVGFSLRLTVLRDVERGGWRRASKRLVRRTIGLLLLGFVVYHFDGRYPTWADLQAVGVKGFFERAFKRSYFQTLVHIAVATVWVVPVIARSARTRLVFALGSAALHVGLSAWFNYDWVFQDPRGIDGGPLGFLTWALPLLAGAYAHDVVVAESPARAAGRTAAWGVGLAALGFALSCLSGLYTVPVADRVPVRGAAERAESPVIPPLARALADPALLVVEPPFVAPPGPEVRRRNYWMMAQRPGTLSYQVYAAGLALLACAAFLIVTGVWGIELAVFRALGRNALFAYVFEALTSTAIKGFAPKDSPLWWALAMFALHLAIVWLACRHLEKQRVFLRV